jgi:hypothetical protein
MERKAICPKCGAENLSWRSLCQQCGEELHKNEGKLPNVRRPRAVFWFPFLSGLIGTGLFGGLIALATLFAPQDRYLLSLIAIPLIGLGLGWKWPLAGGVLLILASLAVIIFMITAGATDVLGIGVTLLIFIPLLTSGILYIMARK